MLLASDRWLMDEVARARDGRGRAVRLPDDLLRAIAAACERGCDPELGPASDGSDICCGGTFCKADDRTEARMDVLDGECGGWVGGWIGRPVPASGSWMLIRVNRLDDMRRLQRTCGGPNLDPERAFFGKSLSTWRRNIGANFHLHMAGPITQRSTFRSCMTVWIGQRCTLTWGAQKVQGQEAHVLGGCHRKDTPLRLACPRGVVELHPCARNTVSLDIAVETALLLIVRATVAVASPPSIFSSKRLPELRCRGAVGGRGLALAYRARAPVRNDEMYHRLQ